MEIIKVSDVIKTELAVTADKAKHLKIHFEENIKAKKPFTIDFSDVRSLTTAFLNIAIGELYKLESPEELNKYVKIDVGTLTQVQYEKVKLVMENSKNKISKETIDEVSLHG